jgi:hypothetical protein
MKYGYGSGAMRELIDASMKAANDHRTEAKSKVPDCRGNKVDSGIGLRSILAQAWDL